jgi:hydrogenase maturation protein HypF
MDGVAAGGEDGAGLMPGRDALQRVRLRLRGAVQGVGFRPFVYRLAHRMGVTGWVANDPGGVIIEAEADAGTVERFLGALMTEAPRAAQIHDVRADLLDPEHDSEFRILGSEQSGEKSAVLLPDLTTCDACMRDVRDAQNRRAGYAFTNCTDCGPRFSIIRGLPYDRPATTMAGFRMCPQCAAEYVDPLDRRFHAQPNACPECGPQLALLDGSGLALDCPDPLAAAAAALTAGRVVAVMGLGGFHLMVDARNDEAVAMLRRRKSRPSRPLAVMAASLAQARRFVTIDDEAAALLRSAEGPIVLLPRCGAPAATAQAGDAPEPASASAPASAPARAAHMALADGVAPGHPRIGVMLPTTPLHYLLLAACGGPVVATSGNLSDEPICTDAQEAVERLGGIADLFLVHDRPIERHVDDSVAEITAGKPRLLRRARGYAPLPILLAAPVPTLLAAGAHLKNALALSSGRQVFISQHIGDLETPAALTAFERVAADLLRLYDAPPVAVAHDLHPDYASTRWAVDFARERRIMAIPVQHHHAHLAACMAENGVAGETLGVVWDGTGYGTDGTIWGGEFLLGTAAAARRAAHLLPFRLPGGDAAARDPRRAAVALLHAAYGPDALERAAADCAHPAHAALAALPAAALRTLQHMLQSGLNTPVTSSAGRLLDGISALLGLGATASYEGEPAIRLEHAAAPGEDGVYDMGSAGAGVGGARLLDWRPMLSAVLDDVRRGTGRDLIAARVHNTLAAAIVRQAELTGCERVALSGGCFQNRLLTERCAALLRRRGFTPLLHRQVPPNDGGIALGQLVIAAARVGADPARATSLGVTGAIAVARGLSVTDAVPAAVPVAALTGAAGVGAAGETGAAGAAGAPRAAGAAGAARAAGAAGAAGAGGTAAGAGS